MKDIIAHVITSIVLSVMYAWMQNVSHKREEEAKTYKAQNKFMMQVPEDLSKICGSFVILSVIMIVTFTYFYLQGNPTVTTGHFGFCVVFMSIGVLGSIWCNRMFIYVNNDNMEIHRMLHKPQSVDLRKVIVKQDSKGTMRLYDTDTNKHLVQVDIAMSNCYSLYRYFRRHSQIDSDGKEDVDINEEVSNS